MRTTLTLEDDVSAALDVLRRQQGLSLKDAVNNALRRGLGALAETDPPKTAFVTTSVDLGSALLPLDNVAEALSAADGEAFR